MYDDYSSVAHTFFPNAIHIVDTFHVIRLLTTTINQIRVRTMNLKTLKCSPEYNFMKQHWKFFLTRSHLIPDKYYNYQKTGEIFHYDYLLRRCLSLNIDLLTAYNILQDLFRYDIEVFTKLLLDWLINYDFFHLKCLNIYLLRDKQLLI